ncbi:tryptophan synthase subunit alpha [Methylocaldum szegediense]|uniref:Tryptophan synthase alpha chain n=1 Tax=Methylocaldum szegediense TaxID=73780 RepID=A0ABM9HX94_9GAMM|nr:tryptophan synthase subunit alpha [Methylocaldum szegediense]CAI8747310.1 Tryptophan synthase alpha chain [Methylocaldum szegediense]
MSRLTAKFQALKQAHRKALIPFITAGDPEPDFTVPAMHAMVEAGADIIELGVPFSDPMADGPVIQKASERALAHRMSLRRVLDMVERFRSTDSETPIVLMGYLNPVECMGYPAFVERAKSAGVDGVLTVDMPPEESSELVSLLEQAGIDPIFLLAPNSTDERIRKMGQLGRGYLYYVSLKGVTGASHLDLSDVERKLSEIRALVDLPLGVGFGVKNAEVAAAISKFADAVVVGSALVEKIEVAQGDTDRALTAIVELLKSMRAAMDASS